MNKKLCFLNDLANKKAVKINNQCDEKTNLSKINIFKVTFIFTVDILIRICIIKKTDPNPH